MKCTVFLLYLFSFIFLTNSRSIDKSFSHNIHFNQNQSSKSIVYNKVLQLFTLKNPSADEVFLGQIGGLATSLHNPNQLVIFHRGSREWNDKEGYVIDEDNWKELVVQNGSKLIEELALKIKEKIFRSFPDGYHFDRQNFGPIENETVLTVDIRSGEIVHEWGNNSFFMPHGLLIDKEENIWLTDVAMHQVNVFGNNLSDENCLKKVFKYSNGKRVLALGELFVPGDDHLHFCKPTDVVLSDDKLFLYVADGYCNSRIVKFHSNGTFLREYKMPQDQKQLFIPHSLVLIESLHLICVADRQNGRIVCFDTKETNDGEVKYIVEHSSMNTVYAITYHPKKNLLYAVSGKDLFNEALGYTFSAHPQSFGDLLQTWKPTDKFGEPHDLALSADGLSLFVGGIRPNLIHLFDILN